MVFRNWDNKLQTWIDSQVYHSERHITIRHHRQNIMYSGVHILLDFMLWILVNCLCSVFSSNYSSHLIFVLCVFVLSLFCWYFICVLHAVFPFACFFYYKEMFPFVCIKFKLYIYIERREKKIVQNKKKLEILFILCRKTSEKIDWIRWHVVARIQFNFSDGNKLLIETNRLINRKLFLWRIFMQIPYIYHTIQSDSQCFIQCQSI